MGNEINEIMDGMFNGDKSQQEVVLLLSGAARVYDAVTGAMQVTGVLRSMSTGEYNELLNDLHTQLGFVCESSKEFFMALSDAAATERESVDGS